MRLISPPEIKGKKILLRLDLNVDIGDDGQILNSFRIEKIIPTLEFLLNYQPDKIIIISHLKRPQLPQDRNNPLFSLKPVAQYLENRLAKKVYFLIDDLEKENDLKEKIKLLPQNALIMLENIRFYEGEEKNDLDFARKLAVLGNIYINDAFSVAHRKGASTCAIIGLLPSFLGPLFVSEIEHLDQLKNSSEKILLILGGAKIKDKLGLINLFFDRAKKILIGGAIANTLLKGRGIIIGQSYFEAEMLDVEKNWSEENRNKIILPLDVKILTPQGVKEKEIQELSVEDNILDIGSKTIEKFKEFIKEAKFIFYNGPMGKLEDSRFQIGTQQILEAIFNNKTAQTVIGGGETMMGLKLLNLKQINNPKVFLSTGGGAMLAYLSGQELEALKAII